MKALQKLIAPAIACIRREMASRSGTGQKSILTPRHHSGNAYSSVSLAKNTTSVLSCVSVAPISTRPWYVQGMEDEHQTLRSDRLPSLGHTMGEYIESGATVELQTHRKGQK